LEYYYLSAQYGVLPALLNLGVVYENGELGLKKDYKIALHYYQLAAEKGDNYAKTRVERLTKCLDEETVISQKDLSSSID